MPPKGKEAKKKVVEDKTFGLKNKKGAKVGKFVQQVKQQVEVSGNPKVKKELEDKKRELERKKQFEADKKSEIASLFKPVIQQKVPFGVDPKSVLCAFFKADSCQKGSRCKFSHDLDVDRKGTAKIDLYTDARETAIKEKEKGFL